MDRVKALELQLNPTMAGYSQLLSKNYDALYFSLKQVNYDSRYQQKVFIFCWKLLKQLHNKFRAFELYLFFNICFDAKDSIDSTFMLTLVLNHYSLWLLVLFGIVLQGCLDLPWNNDEIKNYQMIF